MRVRFTTNNKINRQLEQKLERMGRKADAILDEAVERAADDVLETAVILAPFDTGNLRASIEVFQGGVKFQKLVGVDLSKVKYASYQEFGTVTMSAQPYLRPALQLEQGRIKRYMKDAVIKILRS